MAYYRAASLACKFMRGVLQLVMTCIVCCTAPKGHSSAVLHLVQMDFANFKLSNLLAGHHAHILAPAHARDVQPLRRCLGAV